MYLSLQWYITPRSNGKYTLQSVLSINYATVGFGAVVGDTVVGRSGSFEWSISDNGTPGQYKSVFLFLSLLDCIHSLSR